MALYLLELPGAGGEGRVDGVKAMIVEADSTAIAKRLAATLSNNDSSWADATATAISAGVAADYTGWRYEVRVGAADVGDPDTVVVSKTATAGATVDTIGTALAVLLNATDPIAGAAYDTGTNILKIAETTDSLGTRKVSVKVFPPLAVEPLTDMIGSVVDGGVEAAVLSAVLVAPTAIPAVLRKL